MVDRRVIIPRHLVEAANDTPFDLPPNDMYLGGSLVNPSVHHQEVAERYWRRDRARSEINRILTEAREPPKW